MSTAGDILKQRWGNGGYDKHPLAATLRPRFHHALDVAATLTATRAELAGDKNKSDVGRANALRDFAAKEAPRVTRARRALTHAQGTVRNQRLALTPTVRDKKDIAAAMLRREIREVAKSMNLQEVLALANDPTTDTITLEALFEGPTFLTGLSADMRARMLQIVVDRTQAPAVATLAELDEALNLLDTAVRFGEQELYKASGAQSGAAFETWLQTVAPATPEELAAEATKLAADTVKASATALPPAERKDVVDALLESLRIEYAA